MTSADAQPIHAGARGICVIMAGGRGTRFWPLSRKARPKQLQALAGPSSLLRETCDRVLPLVGPERILVITSGDLAAATRAELPDLPANHIITEPVGRNTAPCSVLGAGLAARLEPGAPFALLPADHFIPDAAPFRQQLQEAFEYAATRPTVVTIGIPPDRPETGYGYLETGAEAEGRRNGLRFVEKPDRVTAETYVRDNRFLWNSGMFVWNAAHFAAMAGRFLPEVAAGMKPAVDAFGTSAFGAALESAYRDCPAESIDVAVMEKLPEFTVLPARFRWSDLGSWDAWGKLAPGLGDNNRGRAEILALDSADNVIRGSDRMVALVGVRDMIIVDTEDALLVCHKDEAQRIKEIIKCLEEQGRSELL